MELSHKIIQNHIKVKGSQMVTFDDIILEFAPSLTKEE
jgi:hypothetical protein